MRKRASLFYLPALVLLLAACDQPGPATGELYLPEGDADKGKEHFVSLGCISCHNVRDIEMPEPDSDGPVKVMLGSRTSIASYGSLVTSIVNPSHRLSRRYRKDSVSVDGESLMIVFNDVMTVTQLTDLIAFLQPRYENVSRPRYRYRTYDYGSAAEEEDGDDED